MPSITPSPYHYSAIKRFFDVLMSVIGLVVALPLFLGISLGILLTSGTPIIFKQKRLGYKKKPFTLYKFRTMYNGAEFDEQKHAKKNQAPEPMFKIFVDPRFVGIGAFLSKTGLDELPQLLNVCIGNMSLVGPRPLPVEQAKKLGSKWQFRFLVKPGIFSEWTVSKHRHRSEKDWIDLDKKTVQTGSILNDIFMISTTIFQLFKNRPNR